MKGLIPSNFNQLAPATQAKWILDIISSGGLRVHAPLMLSGVPDAWLSRRYLETIIDDVDYSPEDEAEDEAEDEEAYDKFNHYMMYGSDDEVDYYEDEEAEDPPTQASPASTQAPHLPVPSPSALPLSITADDPEDWLDLDYVQSNEEYATSMAHMAELNPLSHPHVEYIMDLPEFVQAPMALQPPTADYKLFLNFHPPMSTFYPIFAHIPSRDTPQYEAELVRILIKIWDWAIENLVSPILLRELIPSSLRECFARQATSCDGYEMLLYMADSLELGVGKGYSSYACEHARWYPEAGFVGSMVEAFEHADLRWFNSRRVYTHMPEQVRMRELIFRTNVCATLQAFVDDPIPPLLLEASSRVIDDLMKDLTIQASPIILARDIYNRFVQLQKTKPKHLESWSRACALLNIDYATTVK